MFLRYHDSFNFEVGGWLPSCIFKIAKFYWLTGSKGRNTLVCHILLKSVNPLQILQFLKMAAVRHLGFVQSVFAPPMKSTWWSLSLCKILLQPIQ